jgi:hypothetical protein
MDSDALGQCLTAVEARQRLSEDERAICEVSSRYDCADPHADDEYADLFTEDCVIVVSSDNAMTPHTIRLSAATRTCCATSWRAWYRAWREVSRPERAGAG